MNLEMELNALPKLVTYATRDAIVATCLQITNLNTFWDSHSLTPQPLYGEDNGHRFCY